MLTCSDSAGGLVSLRGLFVGRGEPNPTSRHLVDRGVFERCSPSVRVDCLPAPAICLTVQALPLARRRCGARVHPRLDGYPWPGGGAGRADSTPPPGITGCSTGPTLSAIWVVSTLLLRFSVHDVVNTPPTKERSQQRRLACPLRSLIGVRDQNHVSRRRPSLHRPGGCSPGGDG